MEILGLKSDVRICSKDLFLSWNINRQISQDAAEKSLGGFLVKLGSLSHFIEQQRKSGQDFFYSWESILKNNTMFLLTESASRWLSSHCLFSGSQTGMTNRQNQLFSQGRAWWLRKLVYKPCKAPHFLCNSRQMTCLHSWVVGLLLYLQEAARSGGRGKSCLVQPL